jgi:1-phosphatidylinositol phosphodiesterase
MPCEAHYCTQDHPKKTAGAWMTKLTNRSISELTIPGTHDSGCKVSLDLCQTQSYSIEDQLNDGIRFLDVRCRHINDVFAIHHGVMYCNLMFGDVLNQCESFLQNNSGEGIIMRVKSEYDEQDCTRTFAATFDDYVSKYPNLFNLQADMPMLDDIRGKIFVLFDFSYKGGYKWGWSNMQDDWEVKTLFDIGKKEDAVKRQCDNARNGKKEELFINFCSGASAWCWPYSVAKKVNKVPFNYQGRLGIIPMDFPGEDLVQHLIGQNTN